MSDRSFASLDIHTSEKVEMIDVTEKVREVVSGSAVSDGVCHIFVPHTTAAVTINENADPDVVSDILMGLECAVSSSLAYEHSEGNSPAHIKSSIIGVSKEAIISGGRIVLGTWQGIYFCEFDGPRARKLLVKCIGVTK